MVPSMSNKFESNRTDPLLQQIEAVLALTGVGPTTFGKKAAGDPTLVYRMRAGRKLLKPSLRERVQRTIEELRNA